LIKGQRFSKCLGKNFVIVYSNIFYFGFVLDEDTKENAKFLQKDVQWSFPLVMICYFSSTAVNGGLKRIKKFF